MISYHYDPDALQIEEVQNTNDVEFYFRFVGKGNYLESLKKLRNQYESTDLANSVYFYPYINHDYQVVVPKDHYDYFVLDLMKHRILQHVEWNK